MDHTLIDSKLVNLGQLLRGERFENREVVFERPAGRSLLSVDRKNIVIIQPNDIVSWIEVHGMKSVFQIQRLMVKHAIIPQRFGATFDINPHGNGDRLALSRRWGFPPSLLPKW
jgi:hypothetical protein